MRRPVLLRGLPSWGALLFCAFSVTQASPASAATLRPIWHPNGPVQALLLRAGVLYVGGSFSALVSPDGLSSVARANLAALDPVSGTPAAWNPGANGTVYALATQGTALYAGGAFSWAGGLTLSALAQLDVNGNSAAAWNPGANGTVRALVSNGASLFAGGDFSVAAGTTRTALVELNANTPTATAFDAQFTGATISVRALALAGNLVYAGGAFLSAKGSARASLAAFNKTNGALDAWAPATTMVLMPWVYDLATLNGALWVGGDFNGSFGPAAVTDLVALDLATAQPLWAPPGPDAPVQAIAPDANGRVHAGGLFANAASTPRVRYASYFQSVPALETAFSADLNGGTSSVRALLLNGTDLVMGGQFTQVDAQGATNLAVISLPVLGAVPTVTSTPAQTLSPTPGPSQGEGRFGNGAPYVFPQPGPCGNLKLAVPFNAAGQATLWVRSARGTLLKTIMVSATGPDEKRQALDCAGLEPGLYWLESEMRSGSSVQRLPTARFVLLER